jgi:hypothetical protein
MCTLELALLPFAQQEVVWGLADTGPQLLIILLVAGSVRLLRERRLGVVQILGLCSLRGDG